MDLQVAGEKVAKGATPTYPVGTIAKLLMLTDRRVQQLAAKGIIPKAQHGRYELAPVVQAYIRFLQEGAPLAEDGVVDARLENALLTKAKREREELELAKARAEVAPIAEFQRAQARAMAEIRANVMNVPQRVVLSLLGETDETRFKQALRRELAGALEQSATELLAKDDGGDLGDLAEDE